MDATQRPDFDKSEAEITRGRAKALAQEEKKFPFMFREFSNLYFKP